MVFGPPGKLSVTALSALRLKWVSRGDNKRRAEGGFFEAWPVDGCDYTQDCPVYMTERPVLVT